VHPDYVIGESIGPGVKFSAMPTNELATSVSDVPNQGGLILVALAAFRALM